MSASAKAHIKTDEHRAKISNARKAEIARDGARPHTEASRKKISMGNRKIDDAGVVDILSSNETRAALARKYNVSWTTINRIIKDGGFAF